MSISYIKSQLPHGAMSEIAKRTKLSIYTISTVLSGKRKSTKEILILNTIADYLTELKVEYLTGIPNFTRTKGWEIC